MTYPEVFDVAIIGGGVVGCAVCRKLTLEGARVVLIEKASDILAGASKANSAILHTGFDAPPGSLEHTCIASGYAEFMEIRESLNLPLLETGAIIVAWNREEDALLDGIVAQAHNNEVPNVRRISVQELYARETNLNDTACGAVLIPDEHVIDPWSSPFAYILQAVKNGAQTRFRTEVIGGEFDGDRWLLETTARPVKCGAVINCAGLYGDQLEKKLLGQADFEIRPRKGQFLVLDKHASNLFRSTILPVPNEFTKGVLIARTVFGNVLVGPTAEEQESREDTSVDETILKRLVEKAVDLVPALRGIAVTATYAGIRPATEKKEYRIIPSPDKNWITVGGIRSTGLSAALGIAQHVHSLLGNIGDAHSKISTPELPSVTNLAEHANRDWQSPGYGAIVCHCEMVTEREIRKALTGSLPAQSLGALKRRTRAMMGRCQGFYCTGNLARLMNKEFVPPKCAVKLSSDV